MITLVTYNVLHGYHREKIVANIRLLIEQGADILCIQEAELALEEILPGSWRVEYFSTEERGCHLAIAFDASKFGLVKVKKILLPGLLKPDFMQKFTYYNKEKLQRGVMVAELLFKGKTIEVINAHLGWEGGMPNRVNQLKHLLAELGSKGDYAILAGDFNTFMPSALRRIQEKKVEQVLGASWLNVLPDLTWTCDVSYTAPQDGFELYSKIFKLFGIKLQSRLDYIFSRNLKVISSQMLDLPGSDHRPLTATLSIEALA